MIDSIKAYRRGVYDISRIAQNLSAETIKEVCDKNGYYVRGDLVSEQGTPLKVFCNGDIIYLGRNSLHKFIKGDNIQPLSLEETIHGVEWISDMIGVDVKAFSLTRLDIAANIRTPQPPEAYYKLFKDLSRYTKTIYEGVPNSIYYNQKTRQIIVYDKGAQSGVNENILRVEKRYLKRLTKIGGGKIGTILDPMNYSVIQSDLLNTISELVEQDKKRKQVKQIEKTMTKEDFYNYYLVKGLEVEGGASSGLKRAVLLTPKVKRSIIAKLKSLKDYEFDDNSDLKEEFLRCLKSVDV